MRIGEFMKFYSFSMAFSFHLNELQKRDEDVPVSYRL